MKRENLNLSLRAIVTVLLVAMIAGCAPPPLAPNQTRPWPSNATSLSKPSFGGSLKPGPCGQLRVQHPFVNVTGLLTAEVDDNASISLLVAPNTTLDGALFAAEHCAPIMRTRLNGSRRFDLGLLPRGQYILMLPRRSFPGAQGFPVVNETRGPTLAVELAFHGGDFRYSLAAFTIRQKDNETDFQNLTLPEGENASGR